LAGWAGYTLYTCNTNISSLTTQVAEYESGRIRILLFYRTQ
jgi:hypothetical protein